MPVFNKMVYNGTEYILGGGGNIGEPLNLTVTTSGLDATITWEDNEIGTIPPTTFQKSELVRKIGSAPTSPSDGDLVVTETVKDTYKTTGYVDQGLTGGETYYYRVFSYSDLGGISYCDAVSVTISAGWQPGANTIAYYPLNGDVLDHNNHVYDATAVGTITYGTIGTKGYMNCDGTVYATATPMIPVTGPYTVSCYEKYDTFYIDSAVFQQRTNQTWNIGIDISMYPSGYLQVWRGGNDWNSIHQISTGTWYNVIITYSSGVTTMYVNGVSVGTQNMTIDGTGKDFYIGGMIPSASGIAVTPRNGGPISEIIIENKAWTQQEVTDYFAATKGDYGIS